MKVKIKNKLVAIGQKGFRTIIPLIYILGLVVSLILAILYIAFPSLKVCTSLFGQHFCTPAGIYIASILNLPGYFIAGNLLSIPSGTAWYFSLGWVIVSSLGFYYLVGLFIDKLRDASKSKVSLVIIAVFVVLLFLLLVLLRQSARIP